MNAADDCFGEERLGHLFESHADLRVRPAARPGAPRSRTFVGDAPQHDDMTMSLLKVDADLWPINQAADVALSMAAGATVWWGQRVR
jgi:hypothetical protein